MRLRRKQLLICVVLSVQCRTTTSSGETSRVTTTRCGMSFTGDAPLFCDNWNYLASSTFVPSPCEFVRHAIATRSCDVWFIFFPGENPDFDIPTWRATGTTRRSCWSWRSSRTTAAALTAERPVRDASAVRPVGSADDEIVSDHLELSRVKNRSTSATNFTVNLKGGAAIHHKLCF